jgi:hypothetical protein
MRRIPRIAAQLLVIFHLALGSASSPAGALQEAEALQRRSIAILGHAMGPGHPDLVTARSNLALIHEAQRNDAEAGTL